MNILILGGNGFIGSDIAQYAYLQGHQITCLGRNIATAETRLPDITWVSQDMAKLDSPTKWSKLIENIDAIINCAGALQTSTHDDVSGVQEKAMLALYKAAKSKPKLHIVQISANTMAGSTAGDTDFLKTKETADIALASSSIKHTILRPALVIGRNAYGGTALLRGVSALPLIVPMAFVNAKCQITGLTELTKISLAAAMGIHGDTGDFSIGSEEITNLGTLTLKLRAWLGIARAPLVSIPKPIATLTSKLADVAGKLGWRSPMRTTAMKVLEDGVLLDTTKPLIKTANIESVLNEIPSGIQDKWFARLYMLKPAIILVLSFFWLISGLIALFNIQEASSYLAPTNISQSSASFLIVVTALADCVLGLAVLHRKFTRLALVGMCLLSLGYLASATLFLPALWLDPIGPLVKVIPSIFLAITTLVILDER